ncbi:RNA polymerase factor sigma-54 [Hydrogenobaculum acidophilum]
MCPESINLNQKIENRVSLNLFLVLSQNIELLQESINDLEQELKVEQELNPFLKLKALKPPKKFFVNKEDYTENIAKSYSYKEHLIKAINEELDGVEKEVAKEIVYSLDSNGFISPEALEDIKKHFNVGWDVVDDARAFVMEIEPIGHGTLNPFEYMELQIRTYHKDKKDYIKYLKDLEERRKIPKEAIEFFSKLKKTPIQIDKTNLLPAKVDIVIEIDQGEILYDIFDNYMEISQENLEEKLEDKELEKYLKQRARRFVEAINLRRKFLKELMKIVIETQKEYFLKEKPLKSLMLKDVASEFGISISTVSRLVNAKYVKTPKGVFKLRSFFVRQSVSSKSQEEILSIIKKLIQNEETVYTDKDIEEILKNYGINIARRTVAKYRAKLGIGSSRKR